MTGRPALLHEGLFGFAVGPLVRALFSYLVTWVGEGAASLVSTVGRVLQSTSGPDLGAPLAALMGRNLAIGFALSLPLLLLAVVQGVLRQELGLLLRAVGLRMPLAVLLAGAALDVVRLAVAASDQMSAALLDAVSGPVGSLFHDLSVGLVASGGGSLGLPGFGLVLLAVAAAAVSLLLWVELVVRSAAIEVATLFLPIALAGLIWPATAHWARRLAESLAALVLSKVVIAGVLALSAATLASAGGADEVVQGVALLLLAAFAPYALLRLIPAVEAGATAQLEGLGRRPLRAGAALASTLATHAPSGAPASFSAADLLPPQGEGHPTQQLGFPPSRLDPLSFGAALAAEAAQLGVDGARAGDG